MPLNSTGKLSLGGAVVGESVNLELGLVSNTAVSMISDANKLLTRKATGPWVFPDDWLGKSRADEKVSGTLVSQTNAVITYNITAGVPNTAFTYTGESRYAQGGGVRPYYWRWSTYADGFDAQDRNPLQIVYLDTVLDTAGGEVQDTVTYYTLGGFTYFRGTLEVSSYRFNDDYASYGEYFYRVYRVFTGTLDALGNYSGNEIASYTVGSNSITFTFAATTHTRTHTYNVIRSPVSVQYLLVGGGGGGGTGTQDNLGGGGGGGGGGGIYMNSTNLYSGDSFIVNVGQGGAGGYFATDLVVPFTDGEYASGWVRANPGGSSLLSGWPFSVGATGGEPGLARWYWDGANNPQEATVYRGGDGGVGNSPGNLGGFYRNDGGSGNDSAGGGGGGTDDTNNVWKGGDGALWYDATTYGGGGGGGGDYAYGGAGGAGGGGHGGSGNDAVTQGVDGTGGGGGGGSSTGGYYWGPGGRGGHGVVILRYWGDTVLATGGVLENKGGYIYHVFRDGGRFTLNYTTVPAVGPTPILPGTTPSSPSPTYAFGAYSASVNEGGSITFTVNTTNIANGTNLSWAVTSTFGDFDNPTGTFAVNNNVGTFAVNVTADATTEGSETFTVNIYAATSVVLTSDAITINDTSITPSAPTYPAAGTILSQGCVSGTYTYRITKADGSGGSYNEDTPNSVACGYVASSPNRYDTSNLWLMVMAESMDYGVNTYSNNAYAYWDGAYVAEITFSTTDTAPPDFLIGQTAQGADGRTYEVGAYVTTSASNGHYYRIIQQ